MIDRLFTLVLLVCALVGGTLAIGSELLQPIARGAGAEARIATLPRVVVTGQKQPASTEVARAESDTAAAPAAGSAARFTQ
jgi:hypothetical protein